MKKAFVTCMIIILSLFAVGCTKTIELTDEENKLIAEYSAELLLKYDKNYKSKYFGEDEFISPHRRDEVATGTDASTEQITEATTEDTADSSTVNTTEVTDNTDSDATEIGTMEDVSNNKLEADYHHNDFDLAKFIGIDNASIKYQYSMITDTYPSYDSSGMYIGVEAPKGYKLLVLKFRIENLTNQPQHIDLYSRDINYKIILDNKKSAKQMFTILMDDLYTYQAELGESAIFDAVLLFQISDAVADSNLDMKLQVECKDKKAIVQLQ